METEHTSDQPTAPEPQEPDTGEQRQALQDAYEKRHDAATAAYEAAHKDAWQKLRDALDAANLELVAGLNRLYGDTPEDAPRLPVPPSAATEREAVIAPPDDEAAWEQERNDNPPAHESGGGQVES